MTIIALAVCTRIECFLVYPTHLPHCPYCCAKTVVAFYPWNDEHPCFIGDFDSTDPWEHDFRYEDTSCGDEIYFQQSGHMQCANCGHCETADGFYGDDF